MTKTPRVNWHQRGLRSAALIGAAVMSAAGLLLTGCGTHGLSAASSAGRPASGVSSGGAHSAALGGAAAAVPAPQNAPQKEPSGNARPITPAARLLLAQSIIYTASLTVQTGNVPAAVQRATAIVTALGGYTAAEQESSQPGRRQVSTASLQLKVPAPGYQAALAQLRTGLGTQTALSQQAQNVTQQVADVTSRVTSAQAAIAQLRALLARAGSVSELLNVQDQINSQEADLEALQAQQRALVHATTFATVSLLLVSHHRPPAKQQEKKQRGFIAGLAAGWRGLGRALTWLLTVIGIVLPFALLVGLAGGIGYLGWRRVLRHRPAPNPVEPTAAD
jgi:hypothetical protein